jgi:hypothetical protein
MMRELRGRLTYANVMATIAVFGVLGGIGYAASSLPRNSVGRRQLKDNAVNGDKVADGSLTGDDIDTSTLGTVPKASHAATADHAAGADQATNAAHAASATSVSSVQVFGPTSASAGTANKVLATYGPFTLVGTCDTHGGVDLFADVSITSSEAHSAAAGDNDRNADFGPGDSVDIKQDTGSAGPPETSTGYNDTFDAMAPSGRSLTGTVQSWVSEDDGMCKWQGSLIITG